MALAGLEPDNIMRRGIDEDRNSLGRTDGETEKIERRLSGSGGGGGGGGARRPAPQRRPAAPADGARA